MTKRTVTANPAEVPEFYRALVEVCGKSGSSTVEAIEVLRRGESLDARMRAVSIALAAQHSDGMVGPWVKDYFEDEVVYEWSGKCWRAPYTIADDDDGHPVATIGDPTEVEIAYLDVTESIEAEVGGDVVELAERAVRDDGSILLKVIQPGWGSSGFYPKDVLERDAPTAFPAGTKMYWDHPTADEASARPERSLRDLAAETLEPARFREDGPAGPGAYARAKVFGSYAQPVEELAPHIGVSIRASGMKREGMAEGRKGAIIEKIVAGKSIDFVTQAGAGGQVLSLFEAARGGTLPAQSEGTQQEVDVDEKRVQELIEEATKPIVEKATALESENKELRERVARHDEAALVASAREFVTKRMAAVMLPATTRQRLTESVSMGATLKDGALDTEALEKATDEALRVEVAYLQSVGVGTGAVRSLGESASGDPSPEEAAKDLGAAMGRLGLTEAASAVAAKGR